jgi:hypothetical protein
VRQADHFGEQARTGPDRDYADRPRLRAAIIVASGNGRRYWNERGKMGRQRQWTYRLGGSGLLGLDVGGVFVDVLLAR